MGRKTSAYARQRAGRRRADGLSVVRMHNTRLTGPELERALGPGRAALEAMRLACGTLHDWLTLCTAVHVAQAIEDGGVLRGQAEIVAAARDALGAIGQRAGGLGKSWAVPTCYGPELLALQDLMAAYSRGLREVTYGEYERAARLAESRVASVGGVVVRASGLAV